MTSPFIFSETFFDLSIDASLCIVTVCLLLYHQRIHSVINAMVVNTLASVYRDPTLVAKAAEMAELRKELSVLSPTNQFAQYFRKERQVDKANVEYEKLASKSSLSWRTRTLVKYSLHALLQTLFWSLLRTSSLHSEAFRIPSDNFWPVNPLLAVPDYAAPTVVVDGVETSKISLFALIFLVAIAFRRFQK